LEIEIKDKEGKRPESVKIVVSSYDFNNGVQLVAEVSDGSDNYKMPLVRIYVRPETIAWDFQCRRDYKTELNTVLDKILE